METITQKVAATIRNEVPEHSRELFLRMFKERLSNVPPEKRLENRYRELPVSIETFITSDEYLGQGAAVYPKVMEELREINSGKYVECVFTGGIGSGKTTAALYTTAYQLYLLSIMENPHAEFGLDPSSEILFIFQNKTETLARRVDFERFKSMLKSSHYFTHKFKWDRNLESKMVFQNRIEVLPVSGLETATIGQNVMGGVIDELNYMDVVEDSKQMMDGEVFDQAVRLYNSIARRRKSRFASKGKLPGILCLVSSRRYPGQFTDKKEEEAKTDPTIYVYDYCVWEIKPSGSFSGEMFKVFIGDHARKAYILEVNEEVPLADQHLVKEIPVEYRSDFEQDIINALREVAGVAMVATNPYMHNTEKVAAMFQPTMQSILSRNVVEFDTEGLNFFRARFRKPSEMRYVHVDLGLTSDAAGLACGYVDRFVRLRRSDGTIEIMPEVHVDFTLRIRPPRNGEIDFGRIRTLIYKLSEYGLNIQWVSFDSFQSVDSLQQLLQKGYATGTLSMDTSTLPYDMLRTAIYDGRVKCPVDDHLHTELISLERDMKKGKIDHPPRGSKDVSDSLAGVVYGLTQKVRVWVHHGFTPMDVPRSVLAAGQEHSIRASKVTKSNVTQIHSA